MKKKISKKQIVLLISFSFVVSCAAKFGYKYYGLDLEKDCYEKGTLLASKASEDKPFKECAPDENAKGKCVVMFSEDFFLLKKEVLDLRKELSDCQKRCK